MFEREEKTSLTEQTIDRSEPMKWNEPINVSYLITDD
jgi:hypothetical protein